VFVVTQWRNVANISCVDLIRRKILNVQFRAETKAHV